ncbi:ankyrin repeat domain-containing protein EMB506, chloroplastic [Macadamia integrifolia]|uniref:ankyrin repeat domain-containing protein EMB506, chloroplastic n=1 Tax=Macadamia integrifolia TaxID=60698 RepID=UPI001C4F1A9F|nr:ankyrin repeat domain-containing protein EMB506, chloroplastic [Macadamia integrifolia]
MLGFCGAALKSTCLLPLCVAPTCSTTTAISSSASLCPLFLQCKLRSMIRVSSVSWKPTNLTLRVRAANTVGVSLLQTDGDFWEDPDDGSGSEHEDDDEDVEENDLDFESDWEDQVGGDSHATLTTTTSKSPTAQYEEDLAREVEQLLGPEEREIFQQNESPVLSKISTAKWSPLHTLALSGQIPFMDKLLDQGVDIDTVDKDGYTALHKAVIGKKEPVISHLLRKGANPHVRDRDGATPLHYAVQVGAMQTVKLLIKHKVDVNIADNEGWTPLHVAIQSRHRDIAKVLLVNGADKTRRNKAGKTPLDVSLCYGKDFKSYDLAKLLKVLPVSTYT